MSNSNKKESNKKKSGVKSGNKSVSNKRDKDQENSVKNIKNDDLNVFKVKGADKNNSKKHDKVQRNLFKNKAFVWSLSVVVLIVILAVLYFTMFSNKPSVEDKYSNYNGYLFNKTEIGLWRTTLKTGIGDTSYDFYYHPLDVENVTYNNSINLYVIAVGKNKGNFTVAYSPELSSYGKAAIAGSEVTKVLGTYIAVRSGFTEPLPEYPDIPVYNCSSSSPFNYVLEFKLGESNEIVSKDYCTLIVGEDLDSLIMLADTYVYRSMGIIRDPVVDNSTATNSSKKGAEDRITQVKY